MLVLLLWACQTAVGVPCFTVTYEHSMWALVKSPMNDLVTAEVTGTMAVRQDGSFVHRLQPTSRFAVRDRKEARSAVRMYLAESKRLISDEPAGLPDFRHPVFFFGDGVYNRAAPAGDGCRGIPASIGTGLERAGASQMFGESVVQWNFKTAYGESKMWLAPTLDCQVMRLEAVEYRYRYMPVRKELFEVKSLKRGEPDAALFAAPKGK